MDPPESIQAGLWIHLTGWGRKRHERLPPIEWDSLVRVFRPKNPHSERRMQ